MAARPGPLVGRTAEQARLRAAVDRLGEVPLKAVELIGEPGIGKTSLLDWLAAHASERGLLCLRACGSRAEQDQVFGVLVSLLEDALATEQMVAALDPKQLTDLATVLPGLRRFSPDNLDPSDVDTLLVCRATRQALTTLTASHRGLLLVVDDMQWVDEATASVIGYLIRHGSPVPTLWVTAQRRQQGGVGLVGTEQIRSGEVEVMRLGPIAPEAVDLLLTEVPPAEREPLVQSAGGNPFFVTQLASHARSLPNAQESLEARLDSRYPPAVTATIVDELAATPPNARLLAHAGAVLGEPFEVVQAGRLAGLEDSETFSAIDSLLARSLVSPADERGGFRFRHPVIASVIYESISPGWRLAAHARAAIQLSAAGAGPIPVARHLERSATIGDIAAIDAISGAAAEARALAPRASARLYRSALRLIPDEGALADRRPLLLLGQADAMIFSGEFAAAREVLQEALALIPPGDELVRGAVMFNILRVDRWLGERTAVAERLVDVLAEIPIEPSVTRVSLECLLILAEGDRGNLTAVRELRESISTSAAELDLASLEFFLESAVAIAESHFGSAELGVAACRAAGAAWEALPADEQPVAVEGLLLLASAEHLLELWPEALDHARQGLRIARSYANQEARIWSCLAAEAATTQLGQPGAGVDLLDEAEQLTRMQGNPSLLALVLARRSTAAGLIGDLAKALTLAREAEIYLELAPDPWIRTTVALLLGSVYNSADRPERTVELMTDFAGGDSMAAATKPIRALACELAVHAKIALQDIDAAREWAEYAVVAAADTGLVMSQCYAQRALAAVALADGDASAAVEFGRQAMASATAAGAPIEAAVASMLTGQALALAGRREEAVDTYQDALRTFDAAGTRRLSGQVARKLRSLGVRTSSDRVPRATTGIAALSDRESEVAQLVADGLTNRQIADELVLSSRTVESHLRRIFVKLDAHSRADVVTAVDRARIVGNITREPKGNDELR